MKPQLIVHHVWNCSVCENSVKQGYAAPLDGVAPQPYPPEGWFILRGLTARLYCPRHTVQIEVKDVA